MNPTSAQSNRRHFRLQKNDLGLKQASAGIWKVHSLKTVDFTQTPSHTRHSTRRSVQLHKVDARLVFADKHTLFSSCIPLSLPVRRRVNENLLLPVHVTRITIPAPRPTHQPSYIAGTHVALDRPSSVKQNVETISLPKSMEHLVEAGDGSPRGTRPSSISMRYERLTPLDRSRTLTTT